MLALKKARKLIEKQPDSATAKTLSALVVALETDKLLCWESFTDSAMTISVWRWN